MSNSIGKLRSRTAFHRTENNYRSGGKVKINWIVSLLGVGLASTTLKTKDMKIKTKWRTLLILKILRTALVIIDFRKNSMTSLVRSGKIEHRWFQVKKQVLFRKGEQHVRTKEELSLPEIIESLFFQTLQERSYLENENNMLEPKRNSLRLTRTVYPDGTTYKNSQIWIKTMVILNV